MARSKPSDRDFSVEESSSSSSDTSSITARSEPSERDFLLGKSNRNAPQGNNEQGTEREGDNEERPFSFYPSKTLMFALMGAVVLMVALCSDISEDTPCELKKAVDSIYLKYTIDPCKYNTIKDIADSMSSWGIALFWWNASLVNLSSLLNRRKIYFKWKCGYPVYIYSVFFTGSVTFLFGILANWGMLENAVWTEGNVDYTQLQTLMLSNLEDHYASDNVSLGDKYSRAWNEFFIKYDCCAVREVQGSTNDFVNTPWCKTNGSCKAKSSKIPKTCCKDVTLDDYQSAPPTCYASVNPGTFKQSCISRIRALSNSNLDDGTRHTLATYTLAIGIYQLWLILWATKKLFKKKVWEKCEDFLIDISMKE